MGSHNYLMCVGVSDRVLTGANVLLHRLQHHTSTATLRLLADLDGPAEVFLPPELLEPVAGLGAVVAFVVWGFFGPLVGPLGPTAFVAVPAWDGLALGVDREEASADTEADCGDSVTVGLVPPAILFSGSGELAEILVEVVVEVVVALAVLVAGSAVTVVMLLSLSCSMGGGELTSYGHGTSRASYSSPKSLSRVHIFSLVSIAVPISVSVPDPIILGAVCGSVCVDDGWASAEAGVTASSDVGANIGQGNSSAVIFSLANK
jgi:hypothetical protein